MKFIGRVSWVLLKGIRNGQFGMNDKITREQTAQIIDNALDDYLK